MSEAYDRIKVIKRKLRIILSELSPFLSESELKWWERTIRALRAETIKDPKHYIDFVIEQKNLTKAHISQNVEELLINQRDEIYSEFIKAESELNAKALSVLIRDREIPNSLFETEIMSKILNQKSDLEIELMINTYSKFTSAIFPYIYQLSLSNTNSRRARAGSTFEQLIEKCLEIYEYPFQNQSLLGKDFFDTNRIGKKVDLIIPGKAAYAEKRSNCAIVSVKTSLRERWQEVVEELQRSNVPHIYLATLDENISNNQIDIMKEYNITLIIRKDQKENKFKKNGNVESFQTFFSETVPHILGAWPGYFND